jgi:hypothetical protein
MGAGGKRLKIIYPMLAFGLVAGFDYQRNRPFKNCKANYLCAVNDGSAPILFQSMRISSN